VTKSILEQKRDIVLYPEITQLAAEFSKFRLYRDWTFGRYTPSRLPQKADLKNQYLESDCSNLCLVLSEIALNIRANRKIIQDLKLFYRDVEDYEIHTWKPWYHLERRTNDSGQSVDNWKKPSNGNDTYCHLMIQMMETWFLVDIDTLKDYYGKGFNENAMPKQKDIENIK
jgi:hypothetical protein